MHWYLVHTKPKQEKQALMQLEQQGFQCYLPTLFLEKLQRGKLVVKEEPLFPRYLFIQLGRAADSPSWAPIRSTKGVSRLVSFGSEPAKVSNELVQILQDHEQTQDQPQPLYRAGDKVLVTEGPFVGLEGVYQISDGDQRVIVLIEMLSKPVELRTSIDQIQKAP